MIKKFALGAMAALALVAGCTTTDPYTGERTPNRTANAAIIGAIGGAAAGTLAGGDDRRNAAVGAAVGAIAGAGAGAYMDAQERKLREQMRNSGVGVTRAGDEITLNMPSDITFDVDRSDVKPQFASTLANVAATLRDYPSTTIDVAGHADSTGADDYNQALSQRRADAVAQALVSNGVQPVRVVAIGFGEARPIADNNTAAGRAQNRRVEIKLRPVTS